MKTEEVSTHSARTSPVRGKSAFWNRRAVVSTSVILSILGAGVCGAPTVLNATSMRNSLLDSAIGTEELTVTAGVASGGWMAPLVF